MRMHLQETGRAPDERHGVRLDSHELARRLRIFLSLTELGLVTVDAIKQMIDDFEREKSHAQGNEAITHRETGSKCSCCQRKFA